MLSRVADHMYWLSRYLERAEHTARLLEIGLLLSADRSPESAARQGVRIMTALQSLDAQRTGQMEFPLLTLELATSDRPDSILACVSLARENARQVREQLSVDMWEELNRLYLRLVQAQRDTAWREQPEELFKGVRHSVYLFKGMTSSTMVRGEGWQYMELGRFLERSINTSMLLDTHLREFGPQVDAPNDAVDFVEWLSLLRCCASFEAYTRAYTATVRPRHVLEFVLFNAEFPRSLRFAADRIEESHRVLARLAGRTTPERIERLAGRLRSSLQYAQMDEWLEGGLLGVLEELRRQCRQIHHGTYQSYISYQVEDRTA